MLIGDCEVREAREGDASALRALGLRFPVLARRLERSTAVEPVLGRRSFVAEHRGELVACFAGEPLRAQIGGAEHVFVHGLDGACLPEHAAALGGADPPIEVAKAYFAAYGGAQKDVVHFGLPGHAAARAGDAHLEYEVVRNQLLLVRELRSESRSSREALPAGVEVLERFDHQARWLYDRCCGEWGASVVRDADYLEHRFLAVRDYRCFGARDADGVLRGLAVYRRAACVLGDAAFGVDWLVPPDEREVGELLLAALEARAIMDGARALVLTAPEWTPWFAELQEQGFQVHPTELWMRARSFHPKFGTLWLRDGWWYQLAETDLV